MENFIKINGWEQSYEISNYGRIKCLNYLHHKDKVYITNGIKCSNGYFKYELKNNGLKKVFLIHRLVALHFIPNPENKPCVNHIDSDITNNKVDNLEWVTPKENVHHSYLYGKRVKLKNVQRETTLTDFQVSQITTLRTIYTVNQISKLFNCKYNCILK